MSKPAPAPAVATAGIIRGVHMSRIDRAHLIAIVKSTKLESDQSPESLVTTLADHLIRLHKASPDKLLDCNFCNGPSDATFAVCPYCGKNDEDADKAKEEADMKQAAKKPRSQAAKGAGPAAAAPAADAQEGELNSSSTPPREQPAALAVVKDDRTVHTGELVTNLTVVDLDNKVAEIKQLQVNIVDNHWQLGRLLKETWDLYKFRTEGGKPKYKNWGQFVTAEVQISPRYAYGLMGVFKVFTEAHIREVGVTKLLVLAQIPDEARRASALESAKEEVNGKPKTTKQIAAEVRPELEKSGTKKHEGRGAGGRPMKSKPNPEATPPRGVALRSDNPVTLVEQIGVNEIPLLVASRKIEKLDKNMYAEEGTINGVAIVYRFVKKGRYWFLKIKRNRVKDRDAAEPTQEVAAAEPTETAAKPAEATKEPRAKAPKPAKPVKEQKPEKQTSAANGTP